ncbi:mechanosensitive ion channel domain-containing protein [candidate division CSSED10-310 bacterium]|uniref:Mechanosensitive ion channel domain-containing protein n=1 Tax=candidate division CSSED10-310 bacterium TaxID=2855610 RepID=A0ABV6Z1M3_UNCC1
MTHYHKKVDITAIIFLFICLSLCAYNVTPPVWAQEKSDPVVTEKSGSDTPESDKPEVDKEENDQLTALATKIEAHKTESSKEIASIDKAVKQLESDLRKKMKEEERTKVEAQLLNLKETKRNLTFMTSLLEEELKTLKSIQELSIPAKEQKTEPEILVPTKAKQAQEITDQLNLLKSKEQLISGKIESLKAELDMKKALQQRQKDESSVLTQDPVLKRLQTLQLDVTAQESNVISLQIDEQSRVLEGTKKQIENMQKVVDKIDPSLLLASEEKIKRKERQTQRLRKKEEKQKDLLSREREKLLKQKEALAKRIESRTKALQNEDLKSEAKQLMQYQIETMQTELEVTEQNLKFVNWKQKFSETKIELENKRVDIETTKLKLSELAPESPERKKLEEMVLSSIAELEKQKDFYAAKSKVYQKEIEQHYILLDQNADKVQELEAKLEKEESQDLRNLRKEKLKQEDFLQAKITATEQLKELMDQFTFHFELQKMKWKELEHLLSISRKKWFTYKIFNSELTLFQLIQFAIGLLITLVIAKTFHFFTKTKLTKWLKNESLITIFEKPLRFLVILIGFYLSLKFLALEGDTKVVMEKIFDTLIILNISYMIIKIVDFLVSLLIPIVAKSETKLDDQLVPIIRKAAKIFIVIIAAVLLIERLGYPVTSIIAGLGIGGLAFALAAKDTIANLFGSIVIFADRPFQIGDWVIISGSEGVVEEVGVRSTKLRTFADTLITLPNNIVANSTIQNISAFRNRRVYIKLGITYDAGPEGADKSVQIIRQVLDDNPMVKDGHYIFFDDFLDSSLNLMVYYFVTSTVWRTYLTVRQEVNVEIMRRFADAGLEFAFPTRTIEFADELGSITLDKKNKTS